MIKNGIALCLSFVVTANAEAHPSKGHSRENLSHQMAELVQQLNQSQKNKVQDRFHSKYQKAWHYVPKSRRGLPLKSMTPSQQKYVMGILKNFLSQQGFSTAETIMDLERILKKEGSFFIRRDPLAYYLEIFGQPDPKSTWGMSFEGHHLSLNYIIRADKIIRFSPMFFGANPAEVRKDYGVGPKKGTRPLADLEDLAFQLVNSLDKNGKSKAIISKEALDDVRGGGSLQPPTYEPSGLSISDLSESQFKLIQRLVGAYLNLLPSTSVGITLNRDYLVGAFFLWRGSLVPGVGHYYRIDHPKFVIELANTQSDVSGNPANHVHALWRSRE